VLPVQESVGQLTEPQSAPPWTVSSQPPRPSHALSAHESDEHEYAVPWQLPAEHMSLRVQSRPSSQRASTARHAQVPPWLVQ
jgi:hypothetical protein